MYDVTYAMHPRDKLRKFIAITISLDIFYNLSKIDITRT